MKKIFYLLLILPFIGFLSCSDEDNYPDVTIHMDYEGAQDINGVYYVVQGDTFTITQLYAIPNREGAKAVIASTGYYLDGYFLGPNLRPPYTQEFYTSELMRGEHNIGIEMSIAEEGCTPMTAFVNLKMVVVGSENELPSNGNNDQPKSVEVKPSYRE